MSYALKYGKTYIIKIDNSTISIFHSDIILTSKSYDIQM